ncbi:hypothetical protein KR009_009276 [Drosophila setifemur]|nr:hypothetical protein KR009_009276 [Drosophila setifemur]
MAHSDPPNTAIVVNLLIGDLVQDAVNEPLKLSDQTATRQRLFHILGVPPGEAFDIQDIDEGHGTTCSSCTIRPNNCLTYEVNAMRKNWYGWLSSALTEDSSEDEVEVFRKTLPIKKFQSTSVQTEQPRLRQRDMEFLPSNPTDRVPALGPPCELTRQTIYIDAVSVPLPNVLGRAPLADRFCYMLTDFASALYCSLAIMCCCTPNMLR